jgi:hypothetical protein
MAYKEYENVFFQKFNIQYINIILILDMCRSYNLQNKNRKRMYYEE